MANYNAPDDRETAINRPPPPRLDSELRDALHNHKGHWPKMLPKEPFQAADYWASMNEPPHERERVEWLSRSTPNDPNAGGWQTPYIDRVLLTLRIFLNLTPNDQEFVINNIRAGIPWRGDDLDMYRSIIVETKKMLADKGVYIEGALKAMREFRFNTVSDETNHGS